MAIYITWLKTNAKHIALLATAMSRCSVHVERTGRAQAGLGEQAWLKPLCPAMGGCWVVGMGLPEKNDNLWWTELGERLGLWRIYIYNTIHIYIYIIAPVSSSKPTLHWGQMDVPSSCSPKGSSNKTSPGNQTWQWDIMGTTEIAWKKRQNISRCGKNRGFLNVVIQAFWNLQAFRTRLLAEPHHANRTSCMCCYCELKALFQEYSATQDLL